MEVTTNWGPRQWTDYYKGKQARLTAEHAAAMDTLCNQEIIFNHALFLWYNDQQAYLIDQLAVARHGDLSGMLRDLTNAYNATVVLVLALAATNAQLAKVVEQLEVA